MLKTDRLTLREPRESDKAAIRTQLSRLSISRWLAKVPHPYPVGHEDLWWERVLERRSLGYPGYYMLELKDAPAAIGSVAVTPVETPDENRSFRIGYWLDEPWWGKGLMSEAVNGVIADTFKNHGASSIVAGVFEGNAGSETILRKAGFIDVDVTTQWCEARGEDLRHINLILRR